VTYKITAIYFILHAVFGLFLHLFGKVLIRHLGWLSHWTMGWACHWTVEARNGGCWDISWQLRLGAAVKRAGGLRADCWQTGCKASPCSLLAVQPAGDFTWTASASPSKVNWCLNDNWRQLTCKLPNNHHALNYRADQSTMLLAAWCFVSLPLSSNSRSSKSKWMLLFNECHVTIKGAVLFQL